MAMGISCFIILSLIVTLLYFLGVLTYLTDFQKNDCEMTFMYEYPQFVRISVKEDAVFQKYGLYAYSEGLSTKNVRNMYFNGIPVLFIPGNAGSFRQVRSFASVSLRKSLKTKHGFHFDFFTVDLNEELTGLNGALLRGQMFYVNYCLSRILELYQKKEIRRRSIIIIGHSMGGIIARGLLSSLSSNSILLPVIITLATPHLRPPALLDAYMAEFYAKIETKPVNKFSTVVALSGGFNDFMVAPFYTKTNHSNFIHVTTTSVPLVWLSVDHKCILWCKQLILALTRSMFDLIDPNSHRLILNSTHHKAVFTHHLVQNNGIKLHKLKNYHVDSSLGSVNDKWIERFHGHYTVNLAYGVKQVEWHMIRLQYDSDNEDLVVLAINLEVSDWVYVCTSTQVHTEQSICTSGEHLSHLSEIVPSIKNKRRMLNINMLQLKKRFINATNVVIRVPPTREPVILHVDMYNRHKRRIEVGLPSYSSVGKQIIRDMTDHKAIHYELVFPQLHHILQSYKLYVEPLNCTNLNHHAVASLKVPWGNELSHQYFTRHQTKPFEVRLFTSRPIRLNNSYASVLLTLDPVCIYKISIQNSYLVTMGNLARSYTPLLITNIAAVVLLSFRKQVASISETRSCSFFFTALQNGVKPYYIVTIVKVFSRVLSWPFFMQYLPVSDWQLILEEGNDFFILPLLLYLCSVGIVWLTSLMLASSMFVCEASVNKMALKVLSVAVRRTMHISDWIIPALHKFPVVVALGLIVLCFSACGGLALLFGCIFYFMKLTQMSQEYVEGIVIDLVKSYVRKWFKKQPVAVNTLENTAAISESTAKNSRSVLKRYSAIKNSGSVKPDNNNKPKRDLQPAAYSSLFFHFSLMLIWSIITAIHLPHVLTWARSYRYNTAFNPDPSFIPGVILSFCAIPLWQMDVPYTNKYGYMAVSEFLNFMAASILLYAPVSLHRLVYLLTGTIIFITFHQLLATDRPREVEDDDDSQDETSNIDVAVNKMKAKVE